MAKLKLKDKWEFIEDDANSRMRVRAGDTGNEFVFNEDGTFDDVDSKVVNGKVFGGHPDFSTAQAAIDYANNNGYNDVLFPPQNNYSGIVVPTRMNVYGMGGFGDQCHFDGGTSSHGVELKGKNTLHNVSVATTSGGGTSYNGVHTAGGDCRIENCLISGSDNNGIHVTSGVTVVYGCVRWGGTDGTDIVLTANTSDCVVDDCVRVVVTNNGSGNIVGDTT